MLSYPLCVGDNKQSIDQTLSPRDFEKMLPGVHSSITDDEFWDYHVKVLEDLS